MAKYNNMSDPWKATLQTSPNRSYMSLHSLWDLIYDSNGDIWVGTDKNLKDRGTSLKHDIISFSKQEYPGGNSVYDQLVQVSYGTDSYNAEQLYNRVGIDACIARYDPRSKVQYEEISDISTITMGEYASAGSVLESVIEPQIKNKGVGVLNSGKVALHDKDSALLPFNEKDFMNSGVYTSSSIPEDNYIVDHSYYPPVVCASNEVDSPYTYPIVLIKEDRAFKGTLAAGSTLAAYNKIAFSTYNKWTAALVLKALHSFLKYDEKTKNGILSPNISWNASDSETSTASVRNNETETGSFCDFVFSSLPANINGIESTSGSRHIEPKSVWAKILKNTYIWIKAPFFGDYIQPEAFNQDLNENADVIHKNLILSKQADFRKWDETTSSDTGTDVTSGPYIPNTSPLVDLITKDKSNINNPNYATELEIRRVIELGDDVQSSPIGSIAIAPNIRDTFANSFDEFDTINLPNYFDPEINKVPGDYEKGDSILNKGIYKLPTIIPKEGNLYLDGRILSPTIDELWIYLKKLTTGRCDDSSILDSIAEKDTSLPIGTDTSEKRKNIQDTRLKDSVDSEFKFTYKSNQDNHEIYGDVLETVCNLDSIDDKQVLNVNPTKVINNNDGIQYRLFDALNHLSTEITTFDKADKEENKRSITNFTAWEDGSHSDDHVVKNNAIVTNAAYWSPRREAPYSLRELEAIILGNKYNLVSFARFIKENYTVAGKLGYIDRIPSETSDKTWISAAGSLYQFHRDYNFNVADPNTFFKLDGKGDPLSEKENPDKHVGMDATFNDLLSEDADEEDNLCLYDSDTKKTSKRPLLVSNYGKSEFLPETEGAYYGSDVYLAADGTWRYKAEHMRLPILRSEY